MLQEVFYKKNELFEIEFYQDKECTETFDFTNAKNLYIDELNGDITPLYSLIHKGLCGCIYTGYIPKTAPLQNQYDLVKTLNDITPNLSKYIPEDNALLFLSEEDYNNNLENLDFRKYDYLEPQKNLFFINEIEDIENLEGLELHNKITIFLPHGTQSELRKANKVAKELKEKYGVEEVNLFVLHCFCKYIDFTTSTYTCDLGFINQFYINKIITTNSTGILQAQNTERLQVIDCKEVFEDGLSTQNS